MRDVYFVHIHHNGGRVSLAIDPLRERVGVAWCSPRDQFDRKRGAHIALGRLRCERPRHVPAPGIRPEEPSDPRTGLDLHKMVEGALNAVLDWCPPTWAQRRYPSTGAQRQGA